MESQQSQLAALNELERVFTELLNFNPPGDIGPGKWRADGDNDLQYTAEVEAFNSSWKDRAVAAGDQLLRTQFGPIPDDWLETDRYAIQLSHNRGGFITSLTPRTTVVMPADVDKVIAAISLAKRRASAAKGQRPASIPDDAYPRKWLKDQGVSDDAIDSALREGKLQKYGDKRPYSYSFAEAQKIWSWIKKT
ncbi:MAG: hypothetical protein AAF711_11410 [Planctomycetota bacterium]